MPYIIVQVQRVAYFLILYILTMGITQRTLYSDEELG